MRASGVFAIGTGAGIEVDEEGVAGADGTLVVAVGGDEAEEVPCIAFSIQFVICAALNSSEFESWLDGSS